MRVACVSCPFSVLSLLALGACGISDGQGEDELLSSTESALVNATYDLDHLAPPITRTWDSGNTTSLSGYTFALCPANFGDERLIAKFVSHRELNSLDNYPARLTAYCRRFEPDVGAIPYSAAFPTDDRTVLLYSVDYLPGAMSTVVDPGGNGDRIPVGVRLQVNPNEYVKDIQIMYRIATDNGLGAALQFTGPMTGLSGTDEDLECPADYAMSGVKVKHSTNTGKLRVFRIECHPLVD
jgi:hypothetical protein